ncbi:MAG: hypothetical protein MUF31_06205 [Akkermansiaceae bacterium]|jgi:hypothetical protein|nr:hypothetical protein [Akkermansiaceae bacterium]
MISNLLKLSVQGSAWLVPLLVPLAVSWWMQSRSIPPDNRRAVLIYLIPLLWCAGLVLAWTAQAFHEADWLVANPKESFTEDEMHELGDSPNVLAGWIFLGWIPAAIGYILAKQISWQRT